MKKTKNYWFWIIFLPIQWTIVQILASYPNFVETYYSSITYPFISAFLRIITGWIPFSVGDVIYFVLAFSIVESIVGIFKKRKINFKKTIALVSVFYFAFHFLWGLNYLREPIHKTFKIQELEYTTQELEEFTNKLIYNLNTVHSKIVNNDTLKVIVPYTKKEIYNKVKNGFDNFSKSNSVIKYNYQSSKNSLISYPLSYMGFSGYMNPFTGEAQVNSLNPLVTYPSTSSHEVAHQLGFAAENEANFIGFLTSINNDDVYFQYSGYYMALRYALNDLYRHDQDKYKIAVKRLHKGIVKNMKDSQLHWSKFRNTLEPVFKIIFNQFLKANKQKQGIKSYNLMIGLLINYEKQNNFLN